MKITHSELVALRKDFAAARLANCKTFTVCPSCYKALKKRKPRKDSKNLSCYDCNICGLPSRHELPTYKIRHSVPLKEATAKLQKENPELFL
jgi:hypothetical protein